MLLKLKIYACSKTLVSNSINLSSSHDKPLNYRANFEL